MSNGVGVPLDWTGGRILPDWGDPIALGHFSHDLIAHWLSAEQEECEFVCDGGQSAVLLAEVTGWSAGSGFKTIAHIGKHSKKTE